MPGTVSEGMDLGPPRKVIAIGWDGACWDLLDPWIRGGRLPNLAGLIERGVSSALQSTPLPLSPAAWTTIITGQNPAKHGVFDWFERKPGSYDVEYVHTGRIGAKPLWEYFNENGKSTGVFNLPMLYPAVPVDGFMISGMAAPSPKALNFTYPAELIEQVEASEGSYFVAEAEIYKYGREDEYLQSILDWLDYQRGLVHFLIENRPCDAYLFVFMQSDHVQHKFWRYLESSFPGYDPDHDSKYQDGIFRVYYALDEILGDLVAYFGKDADYIVLSDHGAGPNHGVMYINRWLKQQGLLSLRQSLSTRAKTWVSKGNFVLRAYHLLASLGLGQAAQLVSKPARNKIVNAFLSFEDVDWSRTKAYSRGAFGQIYLNLKGREPQGIVEPGDQAEKLVADIIAGLRRLVHPVTGQNLITQIHRRDEVMEGPYLERAADILFSIQDYAYQSAVKFGLESPEIIGPSEYEDSGSHRPEGVLVMAGPNIQPGVHIQKASLADITPTLLALADLPLPPDLDGRPLREAFTEQQNRRIRFGESIAAASPVSPGGPQLTDDEMAELEDRLRNLGYLG
ncbi:MAG TPA: alkaline phosphatase family protein [Anaerolineales bacterium]|nr:alkaline phosphatase family protein [Anaerolineales bacterium]